MNCVTYEICYCECYNDTDLDSVCDELDNCPDDYNPDQEDEDGKDEKLKGTQHLGWLQQDGSGVLNAFDQLGKPEEVDSS